VMVGGHDEGTRGRDALGVDHVDAAIEEREQQPGERPDQPIGRGDVAQSDTRWPSSATAAGQPRRLVIASRSADAASGSPWTT